MTQNWPTKTIAECAASEPYSTQIGPFGKALTPDEYTPSGVPLLRGVNVNHGRFYDDDFVFVSEETAARFTKFESHPGDVLLVHKGTLGKIGLMPAKRRFSKYLMGNSMLRVKCNPDVLLPEYLYYWLTSADGQHYLFSRVSQVGVPQIQTPLKTLRAAALPVPPIRVQESVISALGSLDDKIELNQRANETLEAMARTVFQSWFVDFDPVRAKVDGQKPQGMDATTAKLFPDSFEPSAIGPIPKGWRVVTLGEALELAYGKALQEEKRVAGGIPVYGSNGQVGTHNVPLVSGPGVVVGRKGCPGVITWSQYDFYPIDTAFYVVAGHGSPGLHFWRFALEHQDLGRLNNDSAVPGLSRPLAYRSLQVIPPPEVDQRFKAFVQPLFDAIAASETESRTLAATRDALLPKLLSGEVSAMPR